MISTTEARTNRALPPTPLRWSGRARLAVTLIGLIGAGWVANGWIANGWPGGGWPGGGWPGGGWPGAGWIASGWIANARAADAPASGSPPSATPSGLPSGQPAPPAEPPILTDPAQSLAAMADGLDKDAGFVVARVEDRTITKGDVADVIRATPINLASLGYKVLFTRAMDELLRQRLAALSGEKAGLDNDPVVRRREKSAAERVLAEAWVDRQADAAVTDKAIQLRYDEQIAGKPGPEEVSARVILVPTEVQALDLISKLRAGADFSDLARQYSKDFSATRGGDIGYVAQAALSAEVGAVMFSLAPGQVNAYPVHALPGYFIIRVEGRRQRATPSLDVARPVLVGELRREAAAAALDSLTSAIRLKNPAAPPSK